MKKAVESVTSGHPDKICDQIADAIVDEFLRRDTSASVDINVMGSNGMLMIGGEISSEADFDMAELAKQVYKEIGYEDEIEVFVNVEASQFKHSAHETVIVNGFATRETREFLPRPVVYAHNIARRLDDLRKTDPSFAWLNPHGKVQIIMEKDKILSVTVITSHSTDITPQDVKTAILERIISPIIGSDQVKLFINPIGPFTTYGFQADSGANGRKTNIDTYGGLIPSGSSALSGKDPIKAVRAGTYMARYAAKYLVQESLTDAAMINVAYTIGQAEPIHLEVRAADKDFTKLIKEKFDFRPEAIAERLDLRKPIYRQTATYGHFGRSGFPWEML